MNERKGSMIGAATWEFARRIVHPEVEGKQNFEIARRHLEAGGSVIMYPNHRPGKMDTPLVGAAIEDNDIPLDRSGVFVSRRHVDSRIGLPNRIQHYLLVDKWSKYPGVTMIPIVQPKDRGKYKEDWDEFNQDARDKAETFVKTPGNVFIITPEGERSEHELKEAEVGLAALFREAKDIALAMPIGIPHGTSRVIAGVPFSWSESLEDHRRNPSMRTKDRMMARLALLLPEENRGFYAQMAEEFVMPTPPNPQI